MLIYNESYAFKNDIEKSEISFYSAIDELGVEPVSDLHVRHEFMWTLCRPSLFWRLLLFVTGCPLLFFFSFFSLFRASSFF